MKVTIAYPLTDTGRVRTVIYQGVTAEIDGEVEKLPERERQVLARSLRSRPAGGDPLSVVDFLYMGQLVSLLFSPEAQPLIDAAGVKPDAAIIDVTDDVDAFIEHARGRLWEREPKLRQLA